MEYIYVPNFKKQRVKSGVSQNKLAERLGISPRTVIKYEKNGKMPVDIYKQLHEMRPDLYPLRVESAEDRRPQPERLYNTVYFNIREMLDFFDIPSVKLAKKCGVSKYLMKKYVEEGKMPADVYDMMREKYPDLFPEY